MFHNFVRNAARLAFLICCLSAIWQPADAYAQGEEDVAALKQKVGELIRKQQYTEALPLLESFTGWAMADWTGNRHRQSDQGCRDASGA
jgi:hypothetical protein